MKNLFVFALFAVTALRERLVGWRYPLIRRGFKPLRFRYVKERMESFIHLKLKYSKLRGYLENRGRNTVLVTETDGEALWVNVYLAHILSEEELLSPCHERTINPMRGIDGTFSFLSQGGDIRKPMRRLPAYFLNDEPVMSFKVKWTDNEKEYIRDLLELEGPYLNSESFDISMV